jgi:hypothetical protein
MESVSVNFVNWTSEDFTHKWDSVDYTFKAGQSTYLQDYLAKHFAKHLAQRECNRGNIPFTSLKFKEFMEKCFAGEIQSETPLKQEVDIEQANKKRFCELCNAKGPIKHKADCPTQNKVKEESSFEGLNDKK